MPLLDMATRAGIGEIRIFSRDEKKQDDMRNALRNPAVKFFIGDVREATQRLAAMRGVDYRLSCRRSEAGPLLRVLSRLRRCGPTRWARRT